MDNISFAFFEAFTPPPPPQSQRSVHIQSQKDFLVYESLELIYCSNKSLHVMMESEKMYSHMDNLKAHVTVYT